MKSAASFVPHIEPLDERQHWHLPAVFQRYLGEALEEWRREDKTSRLWEGDASLWTGRGEAKWLGWLTLAEEQLADLDGLLRAVADIQPADFEYVLLLGMGGSVLCPEVLRLTFGWVPLHPRLMVLDSTDPSQIQRVASQLDLRKTLFIVSSKSGTTMETNILKDYFYEDAKKLLGGNLVGSHFVAITDSGSLLHQMAERQHFGHVFLGAEKVGGRFSALSNFGMAPAALMGLDVGTFLVRALQMVHSCGPDVVVEENPGVMLGLILGVAGNHGRDKITIVTSPHIRSFGAWIEQLLAESTGKAGKGLVPIAGEELAIPILYGQDRLFCYLRQKGGADPVQDAKMAVLEETGHAVVRIDLGDKYDLGQEFFRWEFATAVAGSLLAINPFDQPDVESSKVATRELMAKYEANGVLPEESSLAEDAHLKLFADEGNAGELLGLARGDKSVTALLRAHLQRLRPDDYFALLAFVDHKEDNQTILETIRGKVRHRYCVATSLGFGPRYLHSTGQAFKGGPNTGVFLQITHEHLADLPVPGHRYTFGVVETAQAQGDFHVLAERHRRVLRVHLGPDVQRGLAHLLDQIVAALK